MPPARPTRIGVGIDLGPQTHTPTCTRTSGTQAKERRLNRVEKLPYERIEARGAADHRVMCHWAAGWHGRAESKYFPNHTATRHRPGLVIRGGVRISSESGCRVDLSRGRGPRVISWKGRKGTGWDVPVWSRNAAPDGGREACDPRQLPQDSEALVQGNLNRVRRYWEAPKARQHTNSFQELLAIQHPIPKVLSGQFDVLRPNRVTRLISHHMRVPVLDEVPVSIRALLQTFRVFKTIEMKSEGVERAIPSSVPGSPVTAWSCLHCGRVAGGSPNQEETGGIPRDDDGNLEAARQSTQLLEPSLRYCRTRNFEMSSLVQRKTR
ncbi:hypothetical protein QBC39DRAFT_332613 [Podospora conica]|nr:hypothetical protein QBC39DRAFT_332613 [Schizothecium conicum]